MRKLLLVILCFILSPAAFSQTTKEVVQSALTADLLELRKTLSRDVKTYHWTRYSDNGYNYHSRDKAFFRYFFAPRAAHFFDNPQMSNFGDGLYATLDPQNSKDYGNFLLEVGLKAGSHFLDFRGADYKGFEIKKTTADLLKEFCGYSVEQPNSKAYTRNNQSYVSVLRNTLSTTPECNELFTKAIEAAEVDFLTYTWMPEGTRMYGACTSRDETSFVIMGKTKTLNHSIEKRNLTDNQYSTFLTDNGYISTADSPQEISRAKFFAEHYTGLFKNSTDFNVAGSLHKSTKIYMDKFRKRVRLVKREFISDYSNIEVKGFFSNFSYADSAAKNKSTHYSDYLFVDQFSRLAKVQDGKPPQGQWSEFVGINEYLNPSSKAQRTIESSRFNCRQDIYPEDNIIKFE